MPELCINCVHIPQLSAAPSSVEREQHSKRVSEREWMTLIRGDVDGGGGGTGGGGGEGGGGGSGVGTAVVTPCTNAKSVIVLNT